VTGVLAFIACGLGLAAAWQLAAEVVRPALVAAGRAARMGADAVDALLRLGREGREPGAVERRRLLACGAALALCAGGLLIGPLAGALLALGAPSLVSRALRARRQAYRQAVERAAPALAIALADALSGGHSLRGAVAEAADGVGGAGGAELRRVAAELEAGARTDAALDRLRLRVGSPAIDTIVAASLVQRRSGGDLAALLRRLANAFEDQQRLVDEVRVATAQARFTGLLVVLLPLGGGLLAELASPGFAAGLADSAIALWLVGAALVLQVAAGVLIRRIGRVST
jgi:tight adherence protein B